MLSYLIRATRAWVRVAWSDGLNPRPSVVIFAVLPLSAALPQDTHEHTGIVAIIPARYQSSRLPGKALADIAGRPMIEHVYRRVQRAPSVDRVIVATDDVRIQRAVESFGGRAQLTRADHASGTDRVAEVVDRLACAIVVNVQGDEPLVEPGMVEEVLTPFPRDPTLDMSTLRRRIDDPVELDNPNVVKVVVDRDGHALYFSRAPIPLLRDHDTPRARTPAYKHVGLYAYRREFLLRLSRLEPTPLERAESLEQLRALEHGFRVRVIETTHDSIGVDTQEDLERVRHIATATVRSPGT